MKQKNGKRIFFIIMITLFVILNYTIISIGHKLTYDVEVNNCTHMSSQLEGIIENIGIPVILKTGGANDGGRHMWIKLGLLEFDSITLFPVINTKYNQNVVEYESFDEYEKRHT